MGDGLRGVRIRPFAPGDEVEINASFNRAFGLERTLADWYWKFPAAPPGRWVWVAATDEGRILAHYAAVPVPVQIDGLTLLAGQGVDAFAVPEVQGTGLYTRTVQAFYAACGGAQGLAISYVLPGPRSARIFADRLGFEPLSEPGLWRRSSSRRAALWTGHQVVEANPDARADALWAAAAGRYPVAAVRDAAWLQRRFTGRPGVGYLHLAAMCQDRVHAWAVARVERHRVAWAELVWDGARRGALAALDRALVGLARRSQVDTLELWLEGDEAAAAVLRRLGWRRGPPTAAMVLMARSFTPTVSAGALRRLYLTMGDADLV